MSNKCTNVFYIFKYQHIPFYQFNINVILISFDHCPHMSMRLYVVDVVIIKCIDSTYRIALSLKLFKYGIYV